MILNTFDVAVTYNLTAALHDADRNLRRDSWCSNCGLRGGIWQW
jgi:hypothetical protein